MVCIAEHKNSSNTLFMHRLKSSTKFTTWSMNYVVFSLSSFIMISSVWKFTPNMLLARETHMHSFFNFHIPPNASFLNRWLKCMVSTCDCLKTPSRVVDHKFWAMKTQYHCALEGPKPLSDNGMNRSILKPWFNIISLLRCYFSNSLGIPWDFQHRIQMAYLTNISYKVHLKL